MLGLPVVLNYVYLITPNHPPLQTTLGHGVDRQRDGRAGAAHGAGAVWAVHRAHHRAQTQHHHRQRQVSCILRTVYVVVLCCVVLCCVVLCCVVLCCVVLCCVGSFYVRVARIRKWLMS